MLRDVLRAALVLVLAALSVGCEDDSLLVVDLRTDLVPADEFDAVRTVVEPAEGSTSSREVTTAVSAGDDFVAGRRVAELSGVPDGTLRFRVEILLSGAVVMSRPVVVTGGGRRAVTIVIGRACRAVACSPEQACFEGACVSPACTEESPGACADAPDGGTRDAGMSDAGVDAGPMEILGYVNARRAVARSCGGDSYPAVGSLTWDARLASAAQRHADDMASAHFLDQTSPTDGSTPASRLADAGYDYYWDYEQPLLMGYSERLEDVVDMMFAEPSICAYLMDVRPTQLGAGFADGAPDGIYGSVHIAQPR